MKALLQVLLAMTPFFAYAVPSHKFLGYFGVQDFRRRAHMFGSSLKILDSFYV